MDSKISVKLKRHKKRKSRTQVESDSESKPNQVPNTQEKNASLSAMPMRDADISAAFTKYYMHQTTAEFAEDLDRIRGADDFKDDALSLLVNALQQGTSTFSIEEKRRVVTARKENL